MNTQNNQSNQNTQNDSDLIWTEQQSIDLLKTPVFTVTERTSLSPQGTLGKYIVNNARDWAIVIPVHQGNFLMVKQWRHGEKALSIEFPGGVIDEGEEPLEAAKRELLEETGAVAGKLTWLGTMNPNPALFSNHVHVFCAQDLNFTNTQNLDHDEYLHYTQLSEQEVLSKMGSPEYPHALMSSALCLYLTKIKLASN